MERLHFGDLKREFDSLTEKLTDPELISQWEKFQEFSRRRALLEKILKRREEWEELNQKIEENTQILNTETEQELATLAHQEILSLRDQKHKLEKEIEELWVKHESAPGPSALILEIRAGTGGQEAALFARNLLDMYTGYAKKQGWKQTLLDLQDTDLGGVKSASLQIEGEDTFEKLQYEGGVHRVQRIPETEKSGRVHTSTASLAVLPKPEHAQMQVSPHELKVEFYNASGPGGQNVNKRQTAVRILHIPTGIAVSSQSSRNQQQNKDYAMALLEAKLLERQESANEKEISEKRKSQIGWAKRAEKIRTYNFPHDRVTDHRIEKSWHGIEKIMSGDLELIVGSLREFQTKNVMTQDV